ncbi:LytTR family DNA-binding domain-containing protein [Halalkalibacter krulwichiae]|uniref:Putative HTH-type transcriptional regulator n=1 Tax=Halalkalibacter krulwichiae TaxID=199441 RepID=A0A1X9MGU9_9BACI|nr:LytTR family DNA-binding domain-containing protein [Halalkalibacter krulwichiae]ARK32699.1 putative HTH-type transcriptional regulator [Halalkalibacter krulwichiae]
MKVTLDIDQNYEQTRMTIHCKEIDDTVNEILNFMKAKETEFLIGREGERQHILKPQDIHFFYTQKDAVYAVTDKGEFKLKEKLYELEQLLAPNRFVRLSKSVIANLREFSHFEPSFNGTLCVFFKSGKKEYVTRHYVKAIKETLKMNRRETNE